MLACIQPRQFQRFDTDWQMTAGCMMGAKADDKYHGQETVRPTETVVTFRLPKAKATELPQLLLLSGTEQARLMSCDGARSAFPAPYHLMSQSYPPLRKSSPPRVGQMHLQHGP
ncbi:hypothetical protein TrVGV298_008984 [Trichoderma virens]|nr:hypothetical protein TrVGV298_008984 [Trichoderma virens]